MKILRLKSRVKRRSSQLLQLKRFLQNDDDNLDVMDVVMLVDVIINGGVGEIGDLLNIVKG